MTGCSFILFNGFFVGFHVGWISMMFDASSAREHRKGSINGDRAQTSELEPECLRKDLPRSGTHDHMAATLVSSVD